MSVSSLLRRLRTAWNNPAYSKRKISEAKRRLIMKLPNVLHAGSRAQCKRVDLKGVPHVQKKFVDSPDGRACFERETAARDIFASYDWMMPIVATDDLRITLPCYGEEDRLDHRANTLDNSAKKSVARQAMQIAFDIFYEGFAHRDFHSRNFFLVDGQLKLGDFEVVAAYPNAQRPPFPESYDFVGRGLESPYETKEMCYSSHNEASLATVLSVPAEDALADLQESLRDDLRIASSTFHKKNSRHKCKSERIYNSIDLPYFKVPPELAQRDCARRYETFGIGGAEIEGKRLLDLGSNIGGMIFEAQRLKPLISLGVEYDAEKVEVSRKIAAFNGLSSVEFLQADIDALTAQDLGEPFDTVFCLAIEAHVRKRQRLYRLLAEVTQHTLYFEGNSTTSAESAEASLREVGFGQVQQLGNCTDDCLDSNNVRPILIARK